jgi:sugar lactone lactonase YvrE
MKNLFPIALYATLLISSCKNGGQPPVPGNPPISGTPPIYAGYPIIVNPPVLAKPPDNIKFYNVSTITTNLLYPVGLATDAAGNVYSSNEIQNYINKINTGGVVSSFAGMAGRSGYIDGDTQMARFETPQGVVADGDGNIFVADIRSNVIRKITPNGTVTTVAGNGKDGLADGDAKNAEFDNPYYLTIDRNGNLFVADENNGRVRKITSDGQVSTINSSTISVPTGIAVDAAGNIFVSSEHTDLIYKIKPDGTTTVFAGGAPPSLNPDGKGTKASFKGPTQLAIDAHDNLYVADLVYMRIRKITPDGTVTTIAGDGAIGFKDGKGTVARFNAPQGLTLDHLGNIYVGDYQNHAIRKISPVVNQ